jgi:signal transduction histidine kinase
MRKPTLRNLSISLAAKCQLLFGLAVLVIIAGALAVPWQRMEQLAGQPNVKAARVEADSQLRWIHVLAEQRIAATRSATAASSAPSTTIAATGPDSAPSATTGAASTVPATVPATATAPSPAEAAALRARRWADAGLPDVADYPQPWLVRLSAVGDSNDDIDRESLKLFRARPLENEFGRVMMNADRTRTYRYAAAVRADTSCIACHTEYRPLMPSDVPPTAIAAAMTQPRAPGVAAPGSTVVPANGWPLVALMRVDLPYQTDENQLLLNRIVIVVAGMLGGTLAIVVFYLITSRLILQPVRVLKNTAEKVSKGDLNIRSAISTGDEFQQLSEMFNTMLTTLSSSQRQLEETNRSLDTRVGELAQSNVDLYEANRLKSEFLTNVSHELRTPLNAIIGFGELLVDRIKEPKEQRYVENILNSAKQLLDLINDLLDLAKIEAGKLILREEKVNVADVCEAMLNFMRPLAGKKNIDIGAELAAGLPLIATDPGRFQQILYNFVSNAIKFTPNDGRVMITARGEDPGADGAARAVRVNVTDTGPGISADNQKYIFEKFRQGDGSVTRQYSGTGLGLAISRELAQMLGARIELESAANRGTTFSLIIPVVSARGRTVEVHATLENS